MSFSDAFIDAGINKTYFNNLWNNFQRVNRFLFSILRKWSLKGLIIKVQVFALLNSLLSHSTNVIQKAIYCNVSHIPMFFTSMTDFQVYEFLRTFKFKTLSIASNCEFFRIILRQNRAFISKF